MWKILFGQTKECMRVKCRGLGIEMSNYWFSNFWIHKIEILTRAHRWTTIWVLLKSISKFQCWKGYKLALHSTHVHCSKCNGQIYKLYKIWFHTHKSILLPIWWHTFSHSSDAISLRTISISNSSMNCIYNILIDATKIVLPYLGLCTDFRQTSMIYVEFECLYSNFCIG